MRSKSFVLFIPTALLALGLVCAAVGCRSEPVRDTQALVERGEYLVSIMACDDCHSPKAFLNGVPVPDMKRRLSGHPMDSPVPAIPAGALGQDKWAFLGNAHMTAWAGPWGISFAANLTPHKDGLGLWTEEQFVDSLKTGTHLGVGRPVLPPMPWPAYKNMSDGDFKAIFAFLKTLPPVANVVPQPISPELAQHEPR
jgi:cytochrome c553